MRAWLCAAVLLVACGDGDGDRDEPTEAPEPETPDLAPEPEAPAIDDAEPPAIGWDAIPEAPSDAAAALNREGLERHDAGDYEASAAAFARAVAAAPGWDIYRYNLAAALSRRGELGHAAEHLNALLARDLPSFGPRLRADPDLEALRESPHGARLRDTVDSVRGPWRDALRDGVIAVAFRPHESDARPPTLRRGGVYLHAERRFVPLGPRAPAARDLLVDREHELVVVRSWRVNRDTDGQRMRFRVFPILGGDPIVELRVENGHGHAYHAIAGGVRFRIQPDGMAVIWNQRWQEATVAQPEPHESEDREAPDRPFIADGLLRDAGYSYASWREQHLGPYTLRRRGADPELLTPDSATPVPLSREHGRRTVTHSLVRSPDGRSALLLSATFADHLIDRIDLDARTATEWTRGHGMAHLRRHGDALYLQRRGVLVRLPSFDAPLGAAERVLEGVRLD